MAESACWLLIGSGELKNYERDPLRLALFLLILSGGASQPQLLASQEAEHYAMSNHTTTPEASVVDTAKEEADKRFSEFNHRFAGIFVLLLGLVALLEPSLGARIGFLRYLWAAFFFIPGVYLLLFSDPESWPFGSQSLYYVITQNLQVLQHKIFSLLLLGLSVVEFLRVRNRVSACGRPSCFPSWQARALSCCSSIPHRLMRAA